MIDETGPIAGRNFVQSLVVFMRVEAVDNSVHKLRIYDYNGKSHEMPIPNSPTVHNFLAEILLLRSQGLKGMLEGQKDIPIVHSP